MVDRATLMLAVTLFAVALIMVLCTASPISADVFATKLDDTEPIPRHGVLELSFKHNGSYDNNFFDVALDVVFTSPGGTQHLVRGFFYGGDLWKVRFRPEEPGRWSYTYVMTGKGGFRQQGEGTFDCTPSDAEGPVRRHPENPYRWVFADGTPYFPVGLQSCFNIRGAHLLNRRIDGEKRSDKGRIVSLDDYFSIYSQAGFNLFRFSQQNCSYTLFESLDQYREDASIATDELLSLARQYGFRVMFGFFGFYTVNNSEATYISHLLRFIKRTMQKVRGQQEKLIWAPNHEIMTKEMRFIDYCIARWGVYVDFWELLNERRATDEWTNTIASYVRSVDPYRKPISTSWEKPHLSTIDINAPHWYESESEFQSDLRVQQQAMEWKQVGKPVIVGEQGNTGMNWDPRSGLRMRIRTWTALFQEVSFIFWNTSWSKAGMFHGRYNPGSAAANIYLGPEERGYIRILQDFAVRLDADVRMVPVMVSSPDRIRAYGLLSNTVAAAYLHHFEDHASAIDGIKITIDLPDPPCPAVELVGTWIEPSTGKVLMRVGVLPGRHTLDVPPICVDLALLVTCQRNR